MAAVFFGRRLCGIRWTETSIKLILLISIGLLIPSFVFWGQKKSRKLPTNICRIPHLLAFRKKAVRLYFLSGSLSLSHSRVAQISPGNVVGSLLVLNRSRSRNKNIFAFSPSPLPPPIGGSDGSCQKGPLHFHRTSCIHNLLTCAFQNVNARSTCFAVTNHRTYDLYCPKMSRTDGSIVVRQSRKKEEKIGSMFSFRRKKGICERKMVIAAFSRLKKLSIAAASIHQYHSVACLWHIPERKKK